MHDLQCSWAILSGLKQTEDSTLSSVYFLRFGDFCAYDDNNDNGDRTNYFTPCACAWDKYLHCFEIFDLLRLITILWQYQSLYIYIQYLLE